MEVELLKWFTLCFAHPRSLVNQQCGKYGRKSIERKVDGCVSKGLAKGQHVATSIATFRQLLSKLLCSSWPTYGRFVLLTLSAENNCNYRSLRWNEITKSNKSDNPNDNWILKISHQNDFHDLSPPIHFIAVSSNCCYHSSLFDNALL